MKMYCRSVMLSFIMLILTMFMSSSVLAAGKIGVYIDRTELNMNVAPVVINGHTLVPMRSIFEALGAKVEWVNDASRVAAQKNEIKVELTIGSAKAYKNGQSIPIEVPAQIIDSNTFIPLRFVTEALGYHVYWNGKAQGIFISTTGENLEFARQEQLSQVKTWKKTFGGGKYYGAMCVQQTRDGGYVLVGTTYSLDFKEPGNAYLIKLDSSGNKQLEKNFEGIDRDYSGKCVQQTEDGGYIIVGTTRDRSKSPLELKYGTFVIKTDENGIVQWEKTIDSQQDGIDNEARSVLQTLDGGYVFAGEKGCGLLKDNAWLVKLDRKGSIQWEKTYGNGVRSRFYSIIQANNGGFILAGGMAVKEGYEDVATDQDFFIVKTDEQGNVEWDRDFGGSAYDVVVSVQNTNDGGYVIAGSTQSYGAGCVDAFVAKLDGFGKTEWQKTFGGPGDDLAISVIETGEGDIVFAGSTELFSPGTYNREVYLVKLNSKGNTVFEKSFGSNKRDGACSISQCFDGGYIIAGGTNNDMKISGSSEDIYVIKTDADGNVR